MLHYILQVIFFQLSFLLVYELLLQKETFFQYNRWYLLLTPLLSFLLPFLHFEGLRELVPAENLIFLPEIYLGESAAMPADPGTAPSAEAGFRLNWWWFFYSLGASISLFIFLRKALQLRKLYQGKLISTGKELQIIEIPESRLACTFFNTVFLGGRLSETEKQQVMLHEMVHVRQKHSLDLILFEFLKIICWFNPLVYIYQSRLAGVHEFIADSQVVKLTEKKSYFQQLLNSAFSTENISFINQFFNQSLIKKRISMLQKSKSRTIAKSKFLILAPLLAGMLTYVSCSEETHESPEDQEAVSVSKENQKAGEGIPDVPFSVIEEVPVFPGCEDLETNEARKKCMSDQITAHVTENFNSDLGKELGLQGINRVYVQFTITETGGIEINGARAPHPKLQEEAERVVNLLPEMTPGRQDGQTVPVIYSLPIVFNAGGEKSIADPRAEIEEIPSDSDEPLTDVPYSVVEEVPSFPGCENLASNEERKSCTSERISTYINDNFNKDLGKDLDEKERPRIYVQFRITKTGGIDIMGIRGPSKTLEEEARRVVNSLPEMTPGKHKGEAVGVLYSLPIVLNSGE